MPNGENKIPQGVYVNSCSIGGLTQDEAVSKLKKLNEDVFLLDKEITIMHWNNKWVMHTADYDFHYNYLATVQNAMEATRWNKGFEQIYNCIALQVNKRDIPLIIRWNEKDLELFLQSIDNKTMIPYIDATIKTVSQGKFMICEEKIGQIIDMKLMTDQIVQAAQMNKNISIQLIQKNNLPHVTSADLEKMKGKMLSVFSTNLDQDPDRNKNIELASKNLDGTVIMPGEEFSFNNRVGMRTLENGFRPAPVIYGKSIYYDIGGGICQAATTLYNAVIASDFTIVERRGHTLPVNYVPPGKDATVYYDMVDLRFKNNRDHAVFVSSLITEHSLVVSLWGK